MEFGVYIRDIKELNKVLEYDFGIKHVVVGDYGCSKKASSIKELDKIKHDMDMANMELHYISPKTNQAFIDDEYEKVVEMINKGVGVSINDWGLLYKLKPMIKSNHKVYIGRLLTKSVYNWAWSNIFLSNEKKSEKEYLSQNNFNQKQKIDYFKKWNIEGIEVNAYLAGENSYKSIKSQGLNIIGYIDSSILAVARACPIARLDKIDVSKTDCRYLCLSEKISVIPSDEKQQLVYPEMELQGNVIVKTIKPQMMWNGYEKVIFYNLNKENIEIIKILGR